MFYEKYGLSFSDILGKKIHTQFHHRNIQSLAKAICQIKLYFLKTEVVYITSEHSVFFL